VKRSLDALNILLILAVLTSPVLLVALFLRLQPALDRGKELAWRREAGVAGGPARGPVGDADPSWGAATPSWEADPGLRAADSLVAQAVARATIPGAVLLVARDGQVLLERAHGFAQRMELPPGLASVEGEVDPYTEPPRPLARPLPMTLETAPDLASVTKVMATTMAVMLLVDRGELELQAPVQVVLEALHAPVLGRVHAADRRDDPAGHPGQILGRYDEEPHARVPGCG